MAPDDESGAIYLFPLIGRAARFRARAADDARKARHQSERGVDRCAERPMTPECSSAIDAIADQAASACAISLRLFSTP